MKSPVRMVCGDCLRSVELTADDAGRLPALCPVCGGTIDSRLSEMETPTSNFTLPMPYHPRPAGETNNNWTETWTKGSLGTIGRFQLRELLGDGGFGQVFQAYDPRLDRDVALKVLKQANPGERVMQRFFREARAAARLSHPNIVAVLDAGSEEGRCWIAYEYVSGRTLSRQIDQQKPEIADAVRMTRDLADALDHAHRLGVFHRDLKPANVIVDPSGVPYLIDFGLARRADLDSDLTRDGAILGTPAYMSPEQASGRSHLADERSDVYSLGVMLFELLCGRRPVEIPSDLPAWQAMPTEPLPTPRSINPDVPVALENMVMRALATDPQGRYPNARSFGNDLDLWLAKRQAPFGRLSHPLSFAAIGVVTTLILLVGFVSLFAPVDKVPKTATLPSPTSPGRLLAATNPSPPAASRIGSPTSKSANVSTPATSTQLVGNSQSRTYHLPSCKNQPGEKNRIILANADEAWAKNYRPCNHCHPPVSKNALPAATD